MLMIYSDLPGNRWPYIAQLLLGNLGGYQFTLSDSQKEFAAYNGPRLNYSQQRITEKEIHIVPVSLLSENHISIQQPEIFEWNGKPVFFKTQGETEIPFDIFAASFFLISRYEEYLPHTKDEYGRYSHKESLSFKENFLNRPLVNEWMVDFKKLISNHFPELLSRETVFQFLPTYDIDIAFAYKNKGGKKSLGGAIRSLMQMDFSSILSRIKVLTGKIPDPFDAYEWLYALHLKYGLRPHYFFLVAKDNGKYDRHILPSVATMQDLIRYHAMGYPIGLHPSWQSGDNTEMIGSEKKCLEQISGKTTFSSRQHYIRFTLPYTYRLLIDAGITKDFSMGYGSINGFRASIAVPFRWYDLEQNCATPLVIYPFCFMDANAFYEEKLTPAQAFEELKYYHDTVKKAKGTLITIWHNQFFGTDTLFKGWKEVYEIFLEEVVYWDI